MRQHLVELPMFQAPNFDTVATRPRLSGTRTNKKIVDSGHVTPLIWHPALITSPRENIELKLFHALVLSSSLVILSSIVILSYIYIILYYSYISYIIYILFILLINYFKLRNQ